MSMAWEITSDDIKQVLEEHGVTFFDHIANMIDGAEVEATVLDYCNFDNQVDASMCNIEDQLIEAGVINGPKKFLEPDDSDDWEDFEDE